MNTPDIKSLPTDPWIAHIRGYYYGLREARAHCICQAPEITTYTMPQIVTMLSRPAPALTAREPFFRNYKGGRVAWERRRGE